MLFLCLKLLQAIKKVFKSIAQVHMSFILIKTPDYFLDYSVSDIITMQNEREMKLKT